jgi:hypothetical protein
MSALPGEGDVRVGPLPALPRTGGNRPLEGVNKGAFVYIGSKLGSNINK